MAMRDNVRAMGRRHVRGFTIIEMLIVVAIIAILAAITIVGYNSVTQRAAASTLEGDLTRASSRLNSLKSDAGTYPADVATASLEKSAGTEYQYTYNSVANNYCLTAKNASGAAYHIANDGPSVEGPCNGHTGNAPTNLDCPTNYITVPGNSLFSTQKFCVMKYEAKNVGGVATSQASGTPWVNISQTAAVTAAEAACSGCSLITDAQWMTIAGNVLYVSSNWSGGAIGSGYIYSGHNDNSPASALVATSNDNDGYNGTGQTTGDQRRTLALSNGQVIWDFSANVAEWTQGTIGAGMQAGTVGEASFSSKEWNASNLQRNGLPASYFPSYVIADAIGWSATQRIGRIYSNMGDTNARGLYRGGHWQDATSSGVLRLTMNYLSSSSSTSVGFRVAK